MAEGEETETNDNEQKNMKPEAQRIAIAEACGFTPSKKGDWWHTPEGNQCFASELPDYLNDLNAMNEAEKAVCRRGNNVGETLFGHLVEICGCEIDAAFATAAQRAEAFLRTLGKWEEGE